MGRCVGCRVMRLGMLVAGAKVCVGGMVIGGVGGERVGVGEEDFFF